MPFSFMEQWSQHQLVPAICWTLVHSLWQGLLAAAIAGIIILSTRRAPARLRYNLLGGALLLFVIATMVTFCLQIRLPVAVVTATTVMEAAPSLSPAPDISLAEWITGFFDLYAGWIVLAWAIFFVFKLAQTGTGLLHIRRLRRTQVSQPEAAWRNRFYDLKHDMGIRKVVRLLESGLVTVPVTIGALKPVILLPLGLLANLPPEQLETILMHELAHIRRKDYFVNLLQNITETIFFFNPALLWLSALIRDEREACCDDIVLAYTNRKESYMEALVSFQEFTLTQNTYAMTLKDHPGQLFSRIKRMLTNENEQLGSTGKLILAAGIVAVASVCMCTGTPKATANTAISKPSITFQDTLASKTTRVAPVKKQSAISKGKSNVKKDKFKTTHNQHTPAQIKWEKGQGDSFQVYKHVYEKEHDTWKKVDHRSDSSWKLHKDKWNTSDTLKKRAAATMLLRKQLLADTTRKRAATATLFRKQQLNAQPDNLRLKSDQLYHRKEIILEKKLAMANKLELKLQQQQQNLQLKMIKVKEMKLNIKNELKLKTELKLNPPEQPDNMRTKQTDIPQF